MSGHLGYASNDQGGKPQNATSGQGYSFFFGGTSAGKAVKYQNTATGGKEKALNHPLYFLLHDEPNPEMTSFMFRETLMSHLLLWGKSALARSTGYNMTAHLFSQRAAMQAE